jgi:hypothetical protein
VGVHAGAPTLQHVGWPCAPDILLTGTWVRYAGRAMVTRSRLRLVGRVLAAGTLASVLASSAPVAAASLTVRITRLPPVLRGWYAMASASSSPGATCSIRVVYASKPAAATGLVPRVTTGAGTVAWRWKVPSNAPRGKWPVTVTCKAKGATGSAKALLTVK